MYCVCKTIIIPSNAQKPTLYSPKNYITRKETGINEEKKKVGMNICL